MRHCYHRGVITKRNSSKSRHKNKEKTTLAVFHFVLDDDDTNDDGYYYLTCFWGMKFLTRLVLGLGSLFLRNGNKVGRSKKGEKKKRKENESKRRTTYFLILDGSFQKSQNGLRVLNKG